jgi:hypothetical protein
VSKERTIFYSWQSDLPNRTNRGFIQDALERVAEDVRSDDALAIEPVVDRDTAGVPGSPAISDTILQKIGRALGGQGKTGHSSTLQNRPFPVSGIEASEFYRTLSPDCKSVWTFVRQLRGRHFSTCA